jgi:hypothetical protein
MGAVVRAIRLVLCSVVALGLVGLGASAASADGSTVYLDTTGASASPNESWSFGSGNGVAMKVDATSSATVTSASLLFANFSAIATGSTIQLWTEAGDGTMGALMGSLSYASSSGQLATYSGSISVPVGKFWATAVNTGPTSASLAYATTPAATGTWTLFYGAAASWTTDNQIPDRYIDNDGGRMLMSLVSSPVAAGAASSEAPADQLQQYGQPSNGVCDPNFTPEWAKWPGVPDGGWKASWAEWINGRTGGPVCTRTVHYNQSAGGWVVG